jgi:hypothetical protein
MRKEYDMTPSEQRSFYASRGRSPAPRALLDRETESPRGDAGASGRIPGAEGRGKLLTPEKELNLSPRTGPFVAGLPLEMVRERLSL